MGDILNHAMRLYLDRLVDWDAYFHLCRGEAVDVEAERAALCEVLDTVEQICAEIEPEARAE